MRVLAALTVILGALLLTSAAAALVINNGLAPPNPANVINTVIPEACDSSAEFGQIGPMN